MDESQNENAEDLYQTWMQYLSKGDISLFQEYLTKFLAQYTEFVDVDFSHLNGGFTAEGPHLTRLPEGLLQVISKQLTMCSETCFTTLNSEALEFASQLTQCLIVICRNLDNIALVASCEYVTHIVTIATMVLSKLSQENAENVSRLTKFVNEALHFFECMYDPYFVWRKQLRGWSLDKSRFKFRPALLHVEVVPFFYECFQQVTLDTNIQLRLFHVFGAIISGAQHNALKAICPATLDVLLKVLASPVTSSPPGDHADDVMGLKEVLLKCIIRMVHVIHCCSPDQRQVEVGAVLEGYFQVLLKLSEEQPTELNLQLQLRMLNIIHDMLKCPDKAALQVIFVAEGTFNTFVTYLQKTSLTGVEAQKFAMAIVRVMSSIMAGSSTTKEKFKEKVGYSRFVAALKRLGQPSKELLHTLLDLVVEGTFEGGASYPIRNVQAVLMLIEWLPDLQTSELQLWLAESICTVCLCDSHNRMVACSEGVLGAILRILRRADNVNHKAAAHLIYLLEALGTLSITASELKQLVGLLRRNKNGDKPKIPCASRLVHAMSVMARKEGRIGLHHYFDLQYPESGIMVSGLGKWPGTGFTFHAWLRLNKVTCTPSIFFEPTRRQLYCFMTAAGTGFEAFFTTDDMLIIAVCLKKEYHTIAVTDHSLADSKWHCIDVVHASSKRPFSQSQLTVYVDGRQKLSAQLKFPQLSEPLTQCRIGCGIKSSATVDRGPETLAAPETKSKFGFGLKLFQSSSSQSASVVTLPATSLDSHFGTSLSIQGQIGSISLFHDALLPQQVAALSAAGPNNLTVMQGEDATISDIATKLVLHYNAKACKLAECLDLSFNLNHGRLVGQKCVTWDIKDVINCIGGIQVLFPLLEQMDEETEGLDSLDPELEFLRTAAAEYQSVASPSGEIQDEDWVVVKSSSYADDKLEQNPIAGFLALIRNMVAINAANQDSLVRTNAVTILGALLQKAPVSLIDVHVLMSIQLFVEAVFESNKQLLYHIYQYLLFDFRIWSKSEFTVRIGHIQYLSTIIKEDRQHFRKKYGAQYMLDVIRTYYSEGESNLSVEDSKTIRVSLLGLIKYYVTKEITFEELNQILSFVSSVKGEDLISEALDLLLSLLELPGKKDQIYLLMFDPNMAEVLYQLLTKKQYSILMKEKVLRIMSLLLKTEKVYDKNKGRLRLQELGMYPGLVSFMLGTPISNIMARDMLDQVLMTDSSSSYNAVVSILQLLHGSNISIRLETSRKLLSTLFSKPSVAKMFAKQVGWQEVLVRLMIVRSKKDNAWPTNQVAEPDNRSLTPEQQSTISDSSLTYIPDQSTSFTNDTASDDFLNGANDIEDTPDSFDPLMESFSTPQFSRLKLFDDPDSSDADSNILNRSSSTSAEDLLAPVTQKRSNSLSVLHELSQEEAELLLKEPTTSRSVGDLVAKTKAEAAIMSLRKTSVPSLGRARRESGGSDVSLSSSQQEHDLANSLRKMGLSVKCEENMEETDELVQNLLVIMFTVMWKGVEGSDEAAWKARGQVFAAINVACMDYVLLTERIVLVRRLIEMMLQGCIMDLKETGQTNSTVTVNAKELVKMVYNFLCFEDDFPPQEKFNERIIEDVMTLLDLMTVWDVDNAWREMEQLGLSILLAFAAQQDLDLCSIASARLHTLLQTRPVDRLQESCAVMAAIDDILVRGLKDQSDHYDFLIPVMKALVDKCHDLLNMKTYCPGLPNTSQGPAFFDEFKNYCQGPEWRTFMEKQVLPSKEQYEANTFDDLKVKMKTYLGECHEEMMIDSHKRNRERGESKLKFQDQVSEAYTQKARQENKRYHNVMTQLRNQHAYTLRQWRAMKGFFTSERGSWAVDPSQLEEVFWKLSNQENFSRMRPKLTQNYFFDDHSEASRQRDNVGVEEEALTAVPSPLEIAKVKVSDEDIGDDRLGDEEWNVISKATEVNTKGTGGPEDETKAKEKLILSEDCELVTLMAVLKGRLEVTTTHIYFFDFTSNSDEGGEDFKLSLAQLREIHFRRYNLRRSALELFLIDQTNYFLNFQKKKSTAAVKIRNKVFSCILSLKPPNLRESIYRGSRSPAELLKASGLTQKWVQREISNFDYLMQLNTIAGRTYNDLSQYPVFPWILSDYRSETLDLEDPKSYRDLSKPVGAINPDNEAEIKEKYDHFEDPSGVIEKFHYGTHYSNPASVMHYLIRVEPFTTLHIQLQSGKFDVSDRQFHSLPASWDSLMDNPNDVKELIPEFFYFPEFLENLNRFDLGKLQITKDGVNSVKLPPWATSPEDFIFKHRKALESEHVSQNLHDWIDLIFGYKQKGQAAVEALNVFYYCTYEGAVDLDTVTDPMQRKALEGMINNFGQTPCQLLKEPHPRRMTFDEAINRATKKDEPLSVLLFIGQLKAYYVEAATKVDALTFVCVPRNQTRTVIQHGMPDAMIGITEDGVLCVHGWLPYDKSISNYFTFEKDPSMANQNDVASQPTSMLSGALALGKAVGAKVGNMVMQRTKKRLAGPFSPGLKITPKLFAVSHDAKLVFTGGHWDNSLRVYSITKGKTVAHIVRHNDTVTCLALDYCGSHVISGSKDTTCMIWEVCQQNGVSTGLNSKPLQILYGHDAEVTAVNLSVELDMAVSASTDGTVNIHTVRRGHYVRTLRPPNQPGWSLSVQQMVLSDIGQIVLYCHQVSQGKTSEELLSLHLYSINGKHLSWEQLHQPLSHMAITNSHLILGCHSGLLVFKELFGLTTITSMPLHVPIQCVAVTNANSHILVGLRDGKLIIVGIKKSSEVK